MFLVTVASRNPVGDRLSRYGAGRRTYEDAINIYISSPPQLASLMRAMDEFSDAPRSARAHASLVAQDYVQQRAVNFQAAAVVVDEAEPSKLVHEKADARARGADHLRKRLLADLCDDRLGLGVLAEIRPE